LVLNYGGKGMASVGAWVAGIVAVGMALAREDIVDFKTLAVLQAGAGFLSVSSKLPQIFTIWKEGGTGQLSAFAVRRRRAHPTRCTNEKQVVNYLLGSLSRIFTTLQEVPDPLILYNCVAGFVLNAVLALQMMWYWNSPASKTTSGKKSHKPIAAGSGKGKDAPTSSTTSGQSYARVAAKSPSTRRRG